MTQEEVYRLLEELGSDATTKEVSKRAKDKYPNCALWSYVGFTLRRLKKMGMLEKRVLKIAEKLGGKSYAYTHRKSMHCIRLILPNCSQVIQA